MNYTIKFPKTNAAVSKTSFDVCGGSDNLVITTRVEEMFFHDSVSIVNQKKKLLEKLYNVQLEVAGFALTPVDLDFHVEVEEESSVWRSALDAEETWDPEDFSYLQPPK